MDKKNKIKKDHEFQKIYDCGKKEFGNYLIIFFKENKDKILKIGYVASKKVGNAVCRNRMRRLFKEYFIKNDGKIKDNYDIICVAKRKAGEKIKELSFYDIEKDFERVMKKSGLKK
ncbi:MAG: ribonuclease P protein component [Fusobacteriaceae bacterium]